MCLTSILKDGLASGGPMAMAIGFDGQHEVGDGQVHPSCFGINVGSLHAFKKTGCVINQRALACRKHVNVTVPQICCTLIRRSNNALGSHIQRITRVFFKALASPGSRVCVRNPTKQMDRIIYLFIYCYIVPS
jgi:hypothetical protein